MSNHQPFMTSLNVGDVVSGGLRIYRDHFKSYYQLSLIGYLWAFVPVYGWAKYAATCGLISRLAFGEIIERPETVSNAREYTDSKMWSFLGAGLQIALAIFLCLLGGIIALSIVIAIFAFVLTRLFPESFLASFIIAILGLAAFVVVFIAAIWIVSRLFVVELPLAIEPNQTVNSAINRSWQLTKDFVIKLQFIWGIAFLITLPLSIIARLLSNIFQIIISVFISYDSPLFSILTFLLTIIFNIALGALYMPFWQAIKSVVYYDLRSRREGIDLGI